MSQLSHFIQNARIFVVDDEPANVRLLEYHLEDKGFVNCRTTMDSRQALSIFHEYQPDIVLLDLMMPHIDGFGVMDRLRAVLPPGSFLPIVVLTADINPETRKKALALGAKDFLLKPFDADELDLRIRNLLEARYLHLGLQDQNRALETRVAERTSELVQALKDLQAAQKQLVHQERLQAFATMAGGIVHDFNNTLTIVMGHSELLLAPGGLEGDDVTDTLRIILQASQDAAKLVERLRNFYRPREESDVYEVVEVAPLVAQALEFAQMKWKKRTSGGENDIVVLTDVGGDLHVRGDAAELREMLLNLMFNAVDAMPKGGGLSLRAQGAGEEVVIEVADTGVGMPEDVRQRCLEPFFTTKGEKGTGLGLPMVMGIVRRHGGTVQVLSEVEKGTTFVIRLPRVEPG